MDSVGGTHGCHVRVGLDALEGVTVLHADALDELLKFDKAVHERTGFHLAEQSPLEHVKAVTVPTLVAQVHDDAMTRPQDVQDIFDALPVEEKALHWITGTDRRFDGYNYFGVHPEVPIGWFDKHVK